MIVNKRALGTEKEFQAVKYLVDKGYTIVERNFRTRMGEIDIIAKKDEYLVFVEVKYRSTSRYGNASEAVGIRKQQTIRNVAGFYLTTRYKRTDIPCRFDVIAINADSITHIQNAF
ncbi:MAG: YraN family protein [Lachnospira sp.]